MPSSFKSTFKRSLQHAFASVFVFLALILVLTDIFKFTTTDFKEAVKWAFKSPYKIVGSSPPPLPPNTKSEIRKYTEFVIVKHKTFKLKVTTGIRFNNSTNRKIEFQWCYAEPYSFGKRKLKYRLDLGEIDGIRKMRSTPFSVQALSQFNLTQEQARSLISYCRYKI